MWGRIVVTAKKFGMKMNVLKTKVKGIVKKNSTCNNRISKVGTSRFIQIPVSYTHLDVYKRQNVMSGHLTGVQTIIQRHYEYAFYIHCYGHQLNLVIARAASQNQQVRIFFTNLSDVTNFFSNSPQRAEILENIVGKRRCV